VTVSSAPVEATTGQQLLLALLTIGRRIRPRTGSSDLDPSSVFMLHHVQERGPLRLSDLAKCIRLDSSTVSRQVKNLEDLGHLARSGDPDDRRASRLRLTDQGRAALDEAMRARAALIDRATADWPAPDREQLTTLMNRLVESLDRVAGTETG
jgi:DNA-binding MarR family transcriptional regulator